LQKPCLPTTGFVGSQVVPLKMDRCMTRAEGFGVDLDVFSVERTLTDRATKALRMIFQIATSHYGVALDAIVAGMAKRSIERMIVTIAVRPVGENVESGSS